MHYQYSRREQEAVKAIEEQELRFKGAIAAVSDIYKDVLDICSCGEIHYALKTDMEVAEKIAKEISNLSDYEKSIGESIAESISESRESVKADKYDYKRNCNSDRNPDLKEISRSLNSIFDSSSDLPDPQDLKGNDF